MQAANGFVRFSIVTPVYNDWPAFQKLVREIEARFPAASFGIDVIAVDDCSIDEPEIPALDGAIAGIEVLRLSINVGHQRAIAIGLVRAHERGDQKVAVMDSDGEDTPAELLRMIEASLELPDVAIVAQRSKRSESIGFKLFYWIYLRAFGLLTGQWIDFGNFSLLTARHVKRLVHNANIWNNYAATLIQSRVALWRLPTVRGRRYAGRSKMRFMNLVNHGLGAISVFSEAVYIRILLVSGLAFALTMIASLVVLFIKFFTVLAIPGWTSTVLGFAAIFSAQTIMMPIMIAFLLLNNRSSFQSIPHEHAARLVERRYDLYRRDAKEPQR